MSVTIYSISKRNANQTLIGSVDNGVTWNILQSPFLSADVNAIKAIPGYTNRVIVASSSGFYYSLDSGLNWFPSSGTYYATPTNPVLQTVSATVCWGGDEYLCRSIDGGLNFNDVNDANTISGGLSSNMLDLYFLDEYTGVVAIAERLYYTLNVGATFTPLNGNSPIDPGFDIDSVVSNSTGSMILVSTRNGIFRSTNFGSSFSNVLNLSSLNFKIFKVTDLTYYAYGHATSAPAGSLGIFKSINGGASWVLQNSSPLAAISASYGPLGFSTDMLWLSDADGFWFNRSGNIYKTTNSALTDILSYTATPTTQGYRIAGGLSICGECPEGYTFNESSGFCEELVNSIACPPGFLFNEVTGNCEKGLDSVAPYCDPAECFITTVGGVSYCNCLSQIPIYPCCYLLTNCFDPGDQIYTQTDLSEYEGQIVRLIEYPGQCYSFEIVEDFCESEETVTVQSSFVDCGDCNPSYKVYNCQDNSIFYYTESDLSAYVSPSLIVRLEELPGSCWQVGINNDFPYTPIPLTVDGQTYETCEDCYVVYYQLTNCVNPEIVILTDTDVTQYIGKIVQIDGYPGLCWTVSEPTCDCINVQIKGLSLFDGPVVSTSSSNGKPIYYFTIAGDDFTIAWDSNVNRWELYNITTSTVESYINTESDCPFSSNWSNEGDYTVVSITPCITDIYSVNISSSYPDCPCCTNKNCR